MPQAAGGALALLVIITGSTADHSNTAAGEDTAVAGGTAVVGGIAVAGGTAEGRTVAAHTGFDSEAGQRHTSGAGAGCFDLHTAGDGQ